MSNGNPSPPASGHRFIWIIAVFCLIAVGVTMLCLWFGGVGSDGADRLFRGKLESEWIKSLKYSDDDQVKEWRTYGEAGVQVLVRGLERTSRPGERAYRQFYRRTPDWLARWLPNPKLDSTRETRMILVSLLASLGNDAKTATPIMVRILTQDPDDSVRQIAISFFTTSEDEKCLLNQLPPKDKMALLPAFIHAMESDRLRNNAAIALRFYPEASQQVAPVLVTALRDDNPAVRLLSAEALGRVDPATAKLADTLSVVMAIAKDPDNQIASRAVTALGHFPDQPEPAVRALIESLQSPDDLVACSAVWALQWAPQEYKAYAGTVIPALRTAAERKDNAGGYAKMALAQWPAESKTKPSAK